MVKTFQLNILTPEKTVYAGSAASLTVPGEAGCLGVLADHAPLVTTLSAGKISFKDQAGKQIILESPGKGFLEVFKNEVTVILLAVSKEADGNLN